MQKLILKMNIFIIKSADNYSHLIIFFLELFHETGSVLDKKRLYANEPRLF